MPFTFIPVLTLPFLNHQLSQHNAGPVMSKTDWPQLLQTHRSPNLTQLVCSLQGTETWMPADRDQQVHQVIFKESELSYLMEWDRIFFSVQMGNKSRTESIRRGGE